MRHLMIFDFLRFLCFMDIRYGVYIFLSPWTLSFVPDHELWGCLM